MVRKGNDLQRFYVSLAVTISLFLAGCNPGHVETSTALFKSDSDVGAVAHAGSAKFSQDRHEYAITGGGTNIWGTRDAFHYLWNQTSGNWSLKAKIQWTGVGTNEHRKAGWMIRQDLSADSPYIDAVVHGSGLTSIQFRKVKGGVTEEVQSPISAPAYLWLQRHGDAYLLYVSADGTTYLPAGFISVPLKDPVYVGLAVCSHDDTTTETAVFSRIEMKPL
jgi:TolB protein